MTTVFCSLDEQFVNPLFEVFDGGDFSLSSWRDIEAEKTIVEIFFPDPSDAPRASSALVDAGKIIGLDLEPEVRSFSDEDWKLSYRRYFHTDVLSPRLVIRPPWESYTPTAGQHVVTLDPGLSFGTGKHGTTHGCLEFIDRLAAENPHRSFLDMGCGSGILSIAAALLGFSPIAGFDIDPDAVSAARDNAKLNNADVTYEHSDLAKPQCPAQIVAANILSPILIHFAQQIADAVAPGDDSRLIISGILAPDYPEVLAAFTRLGFREVDSMLRGEWQTGLLAR